MNDKVKKAAAKAKKEKAESIEADKALEKAKKEASKKQCVALKALNCGGMVKKGESFTCSEKEYNIFKAAKAVK